MEFGRTSALSIFSSIELYWSINFCITSRSCLSRFFCILASFTMGESSKPNCSINSACPKKERIVLLLYHFLDRSAIYLVNDLEQVPIEVHLEAELALDENRAAHKFRPSDLGYLMVAASSLLRRGARLLVPVARKPSSPPLPIP